MIAFLHAGVFYFLISSSCVFFSFFIYLAKLLGIHQLKIKTNRLWAFCFLLWARVCGLKYTVTGQENLPSQPCVFLVRHESAWETIAMQYLLPPSVIVFKRSLLWLPFFGLSLLAMNFIPIARNQHLVSFKKVLQRGSNSLKSGLSVIFFPEGTRVPVQDFPAFYRSGAYLAKTAGVMIVPVCHNAGDFWKRRQFSKKKGTIEVKIGPPLNPRLLSVTELNTQAHHWIQEARRATILSK